MEASVTVREAVLPSDPYHLSVREDYRLRPCVFEVVACGLTVLSWQTRSFYEMPWSIEELRRLCPGCCEDCAATAYAAREALSIGVRAFLDSLTDHREV